MAPRKLDNMLEIATGYVQGGYTVLTFPEMTTTLNSNGEEKKSQIQTPKNWNTITSEDCLKYVKNNHKTLAVVTGEKSNITVIDFDNMDSYNAIVEQCPELLDYLHIKTRKGFHVYCWYDSAVKNRVDALKSYPGVDMLNGALAFAPPTKYKRYNGEYVEYVNQGGEIGMIPQFILDDLKQNDEVKPKPTAQAFNKVNPPVSVDDNIAKIKQMIVDGHLKNNDDSWDQWNKVGLAIHNATRHSDEGFELYDMYSKLSDKYDADATLHNWNSYKNFKDDGGLTMGSLLHWAGMGGGKLKEMRGQLKKDYPGFNLKDNYWFNDFCKEFNGFHLDDTGAGKVKELHMMKQFQRVLCVVNSSKKLIIIKKSNDEPYVIEHAKSFYLDYKNLGFTYHDEKAPNKIQGVFLSDKLITKYPELSCSDIQNVPYNQWLPVPSKINPAKFNVHYPFKAELVDEIDMKIVNKFLDHIKNILADHNDQYYEYILDFFGQLVQEPHNKIGVALVLTSVPGCGKNTITKLFQDFILGKTNAVTTNGTDKIVGRFNALMSNKLMVVVDEVPALAGEYHKTFDMLKNFITDDTIQIEEKGLDPVQMDNNTRCVFTSNNDMSIKIEKGDRRYAVFRCSEERVGDFQYFDDLRDTLHNQNAGNHVFTYLVKRQLTGDLRKIPMTELKSELIEFSKSKPLQFIDQLKTGEYYHTWLEGERFDEFVKVDSLYDAYSVWCQRNGIKRDGTKQMFCKCIKGVMGDSVVVKRDKKSYRCYKL